MTTDVLRIFIPATLTFLIGIPEHHHHVGALVEIQRHFTQRLVVAPSARGFTVSVFLDAPVPAALEALHEALG